MRPVAATFWVNASRVIPSSTIPNVRNLRIFFNFKKKKKTKKKEKKKKDKPKKKKKRIKTDAVFPYLFFKTF